MSPESRNIYQRCREVAGLTQERAAEYLDISVESIRAYELDKRIPPDDLVEQMVIVYNAQPLGLMHMRNKSSLGSKVVPDVKVRPLTEAALCFIKELNDVTSRANRIVAIACDGRISEDEKSEWNSILMEVSELASSGMSLKLATEKDI